MMVQKVKKRNGNVVPFDPERIESAIERAFQNLGFKFEKMFFAEMTKDIVRGLNERFTDRTPDVEDVQNVVEKTIAEKGYFEVSRSYIIYRYEHTKQREKKKQEFFEKVEKDALFVTKRSGEREKFVLEKLEKCLSYFITGFETSLDVHGVAVHCRNELFEGIPTKDIFRSLIMVTRSLIEQDPAYSRLGARLLCHQVYQETIGEQRFEVKKLEEQNREAFTRNIRRAVDIGRLDPRILTFDLEYLSKKLILERDDLLLYLGAQVLADRYFLRDPYENKVLESPQTFWMRIAMGLALGEGEKKNEYAIIFYEVLSTLRFVSSTPTLFHAAAATPQLSSCYLNTVMDSLDHIFEVVSDNAQLSKWSGGIGTDWTNVRATGALIKGTGVESQGVIPFLKIANDTTVAINRSGRRRGATCVYLEVWHYDIEEFLELRKNTGDERRRTHDMNTAAWIPDLFMKRIRDDGDWTLLSPDEAPDLHHIYGKKFEERYRYYEEQVKLGKIRLFKALKARDLWKKMLAMLFETGHPWVTFKDPSNVRSPQDHVGVIHNSNLCTEITLNNSEEETAVCNLGSVNLSRHMKDGALDRELLKETVAIGMRMLDNVIDLNFYPTPETKVSNMRHRPVGLGIMGFQDALYHLDISFDSEECARFADESMEFISYHAILASSRLAAERGTYQTYVGSKWQRGILPVDTLTILQEERGENIDLSRGCTLDWTKVRESINVHGMRNSNCMAMAPTATISNISGCTPTIEPIYKNIYVKSNMSGDFIVINPYLVEDLKKINLWDYEMLGKIKYHDGSIREIQEIPERLKEKYKEAFDVDPLMQARVAAHRGKWIDQSQSFNIFFRGSSGKKLSDTYFYAWSLGLKTTYYLRTLAASQVEKSTVSTATYGETHTRNTIVSQRSGAKTVATLETGSAIGSATAPTAVVAGVLPLAQEAEPAELKLCRIDDPTCESCE